MTKVKLADINIELEPPACRFDFATPTSGIFKNATHLIGFEFDGSACFRKGTKDGPNAIRAVSDAIESYSPYLDTDLKDHTFFDLGNLVIPPLKGAIAGQFEYHPNIELQWQSATNDFFKLFASINIKQHNVKLLTLGGEHSISYAPITTYLKQYDDLLLVHLDAHADLRDGYLDYHYSHASIIRRVVDNFGPQHQLLQYGIRSGTKEEYQWMRSQHTLIQNRQELLQLLEQIDPQRPIYLTLDLDYFDPSFFAGTGTPEPGGEDFHSFISLCKILRKKNFVGCDVVELAPNIDPTGNSDVFAAKVVRELILCLNP